MAPECFGSDGVDYPADMYSFGVVMAQLTTGKPIVCGKKILTAFLEPIFTAIRRGHSPDLSAVLLGSLLAENAGVTKTLFRLAVDCTDGASVRPAIKSDLLAASALDRLRELLSLVSSKKSPCSLCLVNPPAAVMVPCGHYCLCTLCLPQADCIDFCTVCEHSVTHRVALQI